MSTEDRTAETSFVVVDDRKIGFRKRGQGAPILLANRFRGTLDTWDPMFLDALAESNTVITVDYPGVGYSEGELPVDAKMVAAELAAFARHIGLDTYDVLGWSYGGLIAQYLAFLYPDQVRRAVLVGTNPPGKNAVPFDPVFGQHALKPQYDLNDYTVLFFEPQSEASRTAARASMERTWPGVDQSRVPMTQEVIQRFLMGMRGVTADEENFRGKFASSTTPFLVLSGNHDISFAVENWFPLIRHAPTLQLISLPDAGHGPHHQYPALAASYIGGFLK